MRISDWSSDVCSSDLQRHGRRLRNERTRQGNKRHRREKHGQLIANGNEPGDKPHKKTDKLDNGAAGRHHHNREYARRIGEITSLEVVQRTAHAPGNRNADKRKERTEHKNGFDFGPERKSTRLNSSHQCVTRMTSS